MIPEGFKVECSLQGKNYFDEWDKFEDTVRDQLLDLIKKAHVLSMSDATRLATKLVGVYGEEVVQGVAMRALTGGQGRGIWRIRFSREGVEIPWDEMRPIFANFEDDKVKEQASDIRVDWVQIEET